MMRTFGSQGLRGWEIALDLGSPSAPVVTATTDDRGVSTFVVPERLPLSAIRAVLTPRGERYLGQVR